MNSSHNMLRGPWVFFLSILIGVTAGPAFAHSGRRFEVGILNGQLVAQGINTGSPDPMEGPRPYLNSIHNHWANQGGPANSTLPGYDVLTPGPLAGESLTLDLLAARKWVKPPAAGPFGTPDLVPLGIGETIVVSFAGPTINTDTLGSLLLSNSIPASGLVDADPTYTIASEPDSVIYALEWKLSTSAAIADSDNVHSVFAPQGALHTAALFLEEFLGTSATAVPEPSTLGLMICGLTPLHLAMRRRRSD